MQTPLAFMAANSSNLTLPDLHAYQFYFDGVLVTHLLKYAVARIPKTFLKGGTESGRKDNTKQMNELLLRAL